MKVVKNDFTKFSFHYIGKAPSNPLNLIQRELLAQIGIMIELAGTVC